MFGTVSTLILGTGMCFAMGVLGAGTTPFMILGAALGLLGIGGCISNYFIYKKILNRAKEKNAGDIIELANQIANEEE